MARKTIQWQDIAIPILGPITIQSATADKPLIVQGNRGQILLRSNATDATNKRAEISVAHYLNSEEEVGLFYINSLTAASQLNLGGGNASVNACTAIVLWTAANNTTTTGTTALKINSGQLVSVGATDGTGRFNVIGSSDIIQAIIKAHSSQTANLTEWQNSSAAVQASISPTGGAVFNEGGAAAAVIRMESDTEPDMFHLDADGDTDGALYLGGTTNGIKINKGGEMTLIGTATVWDDLRIEPVSRSTGAKAPSFANWINGLYLYDFDDAVVALEKELFFTVQLPHGWKEGSAVEPHVHWVNKTAGTAGQVVRWGLEYTKAKIGGTFGASTTVYGTTIAGGGDITVANEHLLTDFASIDMTGDTISTVLVCRIFRNSSDAADTYTGTAGLLYIDWHVELSTMGSKTELAK